MLGVDAGGTFTDFVLIRTSTTPQGEETAISVHKVLSTPKAPEEAIVKGLADLGLDAEKTGASEACQLFIVHGSTVATNAVLEGTGARTAFISNYGFADMLTLGRQARPALYQLEFAPRQAPVAPELYLETGGRIAADGSVIEPLTDKELEELVGRLGRLKPAAVAINLLFSFVDERFERTIEEAVRAALPGIPVSRSSTVLPEYREYERGIATWLNASLSPVVCGYLDRLQQKVGGASLQIMQSHGETAGVADAKERAVNLILSGPAAGLAAAVYLGRQISRPRLITFDMGGTSTDVALVHGDVRITNESHVAGYPVAVPMVEMHTIGAGGGSVAFLDEGGMLQVGPRSAGANPGPACYTLGGEEPTVTDANVVLGRLPRGKLAGGLTLDRDRAVTAVETLARPMGLGLEETATGIIRVANEHMAGALRLISVQKGFDPTGFLLTSFGGAGGLHVCALAESLEMRKAMVPVFGGVLSALGMVVAARGRQFSKTVKTELMRLDEDEIESRFEQLVGQGYEQLRAEGEPEELIRHSLSLDLCYRGQSFTLNIPWINRDKALVRFHELHESRYGHRMDQPVELVNLRVNVISDRKPPPLPKVEGRVESEFAVSSGSLAHTRATRTWKNSAVPSYARTALKAGSRLTGPAVITDFAATTFVADRWCAETDEHGNIFLTRERPE